LKGLNNEADSSYTSTNIPVEVCGVSREGCQMSFRLRSTTVILLKRQLFVLFIYDYFLHRIVSTPFRLAFVRKMNI
ncbi:MAG: hypothetical protein LC687_07170, partial [Actinobacteria bacterium]|nr:hypothetical protein [Actinomycetota bacterium]